MIIMRGVSAFSIASLAIPVTSAPSLVKKDSLAVLELGFQHHPSAATTFTKRDGSFRLPSVVNDQNFFRANISVGNPPQWMQVDIELGTDQTWFQAANSTSCTTDRNRNDCRGDEGYNSSASTTAQRVSSREGNILTDVVYLGGERLDALEFGITDEHRSANSLGLGYGPVNSSFTPLPHALANAGLIQSPAFSMWVEKDPSSELLANGSVLFGGVNKAKYIEPLYTLPIMQQEGLPKAFRLEMTGLSISTEKGLTTLNTKPFPLEAKLDSQTSLTWVPESVAEELFAQLSVITVAEEGQVAIPCRTNANITLAFGGASFDLEMWPFLSSQSPYSERFHNDTCYFGILPNRGPYKDDGSVIFGTNFLSAVYTVFDMENDRVSLAERDWSLPLREDILEITPDAGIPDATPVNSFGGDKGGEGASKADNNNTSDSNKDSEKDLEKDKSVASRLQRVTDLWLCTFSALTLMIFV